MIDPFDHIRQTLKIEEVARRYGLEVDRNGRMLCLWHDDHKPSVTFKFNRYRCWSCGASGSAVDLVCRLFGLEPLQTVQKINADFGLGLDLDGDYKPDMEAFRERQRAKELEKAFDAWCDRTYSDYAQLARYYWQNIQKYEPVNEAEEFHPLYVEAVHQLPGINNVLDILLKGTYEEKIELYKNLNRLEVMAV